MKLERKKNALRGMIAGSVNKIIVTFLPFLMRTIILYYLGVQYLGLTSLFTSVLGLLSLAELGIGSAMVFSMYKPIAENDSATICALLNLYKKFYRRIGFIIVVVGLCFLPFLKYIIKGEVPDDINIYILYIIYLVNSSLTYFLFAYKNSLLDAFQRKDIDLHINTILTIIEYSLQIILVLITKNYYAYVIIFPLFTFLGNIIRARIVSKMFSQYLPAGTLSVEQKNDIIVKIKALALHKIGVVMLDSTNNILISSFCGITVLAIYGNYNYVVLSVISILNIIFVSFTPGIGNKMLLESKKSNEQTFYNLSFINNWILIWFSTVILCLYQHFMYLWAGEDLLLPFTSVLLFVLSFYSQLNRKIVCLFNDAAGIWKEDKLKPVMASLVNLFLGFILVQHMGINGVLVSFIFTQLFIEYPWESIVLYKYYFNKSIREYGIFQLKNLMCWFFILYVNYSICLFFEEQDYWTFFIKIMLVIFIPNVLLYLFYHKNKSFEYYVSLISSNAK